MTGSPPPPPPPPPRWHLRLVNFAKALTQLKSDVGEYRTRPLSRMEQAGLIQHFEMTWELGWKLLGDFLTDSGAPLDTPSPHNIIRAAYAMNLLADGDAWIAAMRLRNALSHEYDEERAEAAVREIAASHLALLTALGERMHRELEQGNST